MGGAGPGWFNVLGQALKNQAGKACAEQWQKGRGGSKKVSRIRCRIAISLVFSKCYVLVLH